MLDEPFQPDPELSPTVAALGERPRAGIENLAAAGFRSVQLSALQRGLRPRDLDRSGRRDLIGLLRRLALAAGGVDCFVPSGDLADPAQADRAVTLVHEAIELAADLDRCPLSLTLPEDSGAAGPVIEAIVEKALRHGVEIADHGVPPHGREDVRAGIDPPAWLAAGRDPGAAISQHGQRLVSARLCDVGETGERAPVGGSGGRLDVAAYRAELGRCGYRGPVVVDMRRWPEPWPGLAQTARAWADAADAGGLRL